MKQVIVVDVLLDGGKVGRHVFDAERSDDAHAQAKRLTKLMGPIAVTLRIAHVNDDGYIIEGFKEG